MVATIRTDSSTVILPADVSTLSGFRRWAGSDAVPDHAEVWFVSGGVWVDCRPQQLFSEAAARCAVVAELRQLTKGSGGLLLGRGAFWVHPETNVAGNPDAIYISASALAAGRVRLLPDPPTDCDEVAGIPDTVLEIMRSQPREGPPRRRVYYEAGIPEYWLVDARGKDIEFHAYKRGTKRYIVVKPQPGGWVESPVFGKSFRLVRGSDASGNPEFTLEVK